MNYLSLMYSTLYSDFHLVGTVASLSSFGGLRKHQKIIAIAADASPLEPLSAMFSIF